jgi:hypothetical protein
MTDRSSVGGENRPVAAPSLLRRMAVYVTNQIVSPESRHVFWFREPDIAYFRIAKAANSSIRILLAQSFGINGVEGLHPGRNEFWKYQRQVSNLTRVGFGLRTDRADTLSFSFVRHPAARLYSCWNNKVIENPVLSGAFEKLGVVRGMDFADFVERVAAAPDGRMDVHAISQTSILTWRGRLLPEFVGRVENVEEDWNILRERIYDRTGTDTGPLLKRNIRMKVGPEIMDTLPARTRDLIRKRYAEDFRLFYAAD